MKKWDVPQISQLGVKATKEAEPQLIFDWECKGCGLNYEKLFNKPKYCERCGSTEFKDVLFGNIGHYPVTQPDFSGDLLS